MCIAIYGTARRKLDARTQKTHWEPSAGDRPVNAISVITMGAHKKA